MKDLTGFYGCLLFYITSLNIFTFLPTTINKIPYLFFFIIYVLIVVYSFRYSKIVRTPSAILLFAYFFLQFTRIDIPFFNAHIQYLFILIIQILFLNNIKGATFNTHRILKYLKLAGYSTVTLSLFQFFAQLFKPGWNWPVNIALQEITIIGIVYSIWIITGSIRKVNPLLTLFVILLLLRDSGKASLIGLSIGIISVYHLSSKQIRLFLSIYWFQLILIITAYIMFEVIDSLDQDSIIKFYLIKRFGLILDAITYLLENPINLILGSGFDTANYFEVGTFNYAYKNSPQLFVLSTSVFGGVLFPILLIWNVKNFLKSMSENSNVKLKSQLIGFFISFGVVNSFHEYFNNPFVFFSLSLVILSFNSKAKHESDDLYNYSSI